MSVIKRPPLDRFLPTLLALAYSLTCLAYAWRFNHFSCKTFSFLWSANGYSEAVAGKVEGLLIALLLLSAICIWIKKVRWLALAGAAAMLSEMLSETFVPSAKYPLLYWAEWALRYSVSLAAILLFKSTETATLWSMRIMRIAIALVFVSHGIKALLAEPQFIDYLLVTFRRFGIDSGEAQSLTILYIIGTIDILIAVHLLIRKPAHNQMLLLWMAVWGTITAFSRITYGGIGNWHEVFIRSTHCIVPIVLYLLYRSRSRKPENPLSTDTSLPE